MKRNLYFLLISLIIISCAKNSTSPPEPKPKPNKPDFAKLDSKVFSFMDRFKVPGAQVAIMKDDKLVYKKSYGLADKNSGEVVTDSSLFRVASNTKPITAIAILNLLQQRKIKLNDKIFGAEGILGFEYGNPPYPSNIKKITVQELLTHRSGWTNYPDDPLFHFPPGTSFSKVIAYMLDRGLANPPGGKRVYLNFGYLLLGQVIEKITDTDYRKYVKKVILHPIGVTDMKNGDSYLKGRYDNEVVYYSQESSSPYGYFSMDLLKAVGGWIASAEDLMRFMRVVDRNPNVSDILPDTTLKKEYFGYNNWYHTGSLPGTSSVVERVNDEFSYSFNINTRKPNISTTLDRMKEIMDDYIANKKNWPDRDLFQHGN